MKKLILLFFISLSFNLGLYSTPRYDFSPNKTPLLETLESPLAQEIKSTHYSSQPLYPQTIQAHKNPKRTWLSGGVLASLFAGWLYVLNKTTTQSTVSNCLVFVCTTVGFLASSISASWITHHLNWPSISVPAAQFIDHVDFLEKMVNRLPETPTLESYSWLATTHDINILFQNCKENQPKTKLESVQSKVKILHNLYAKFTTIRNNHNKLICELAQQTANYNQQTANYNQQTANYNQQTANYNSSLQTLLHGTAPEGDNGKTTVIDPEKIT